jgi:hypothetical protein
MRAYTRFIAAATLVAAAACGGRSPAVEVTPAPGESHLTNIRQLTFGGTNAEAYFSADGQ